MIEILPSVNFRRDECGRAIAPGAEMGAGVHLGNNVTLYPGVTIGDRSVVMDGSVLGRIPLANKTTNRRIDSSFSKLQIGSDCIIGCNAVLYTGGTIGNNVLVADLASIREGCAVADEVVIGRGVMVLYNCQIGRGSRIQDQAHLVGHMFVEEHVFIGMGVMTTNDNDVYLTRFGLTDAKWRGPTVRKYAAIGAGATLLPDIEIGEGAMVAAGAVVTSTVRPWTIVAGNPARRIKDIPDAQRSQIEAMMRS